MDVNLFLEASRRHWRFDSSRGFLTVEQLWDVPLISSGDFSLNSIAICLNNELKSLEDCSFVEEASNPQKVETSNKLELVKQVIAIKQDEQKEARDRRIRKQQKDRILQIIAQKQDEKLTQASIEELEAQLASL